MAARLIAVGALALVVASSASGFDLVRGGKAAATIVVADKAPEPERFAAAELQALIEQCTGARLAIAARMPEGGQPAVLIGQVTAQEAGEKVAAAVPRDQLRDDGYSISLVEQPACVVIAAKEPRGTLHAVYDLLETDVGFGFFVDGTYVPRRQDIVVRATSTVGNPAFAQRTYCVPLGIYAPRRFQATLWDADGWKTLLRWMARKGMNRLAVPFSAESRAWGAAFDQAFPEAKANRQEILPGSGEPAAGSYTARMGWGLSPDHTTAVLKDAFSFARKSLGMEIVYMFVYGDYEEPLRKALPSLKWKAVPAAGRFTPAGGSCALSAAEPKGRELQTRLWKAIIDTYGTDHRYVVTGLPLPNPFVNSSGAENALTPAFEALHAVDPAARVLVPTSEADLWGAAPEAKAAAMDRLPEGVLLLCTEPELATDRLYTTTGRFAGRVFEYGCPWRCGPGNDLFENRFAMLVNLFRNTHPPYYAGPPPRAVGMWNWNQLRGVNPMLDDFLADFAWGSGYVWRAEGAATNRAMANYLERRYGAAAVFPMAEATKQALRGASRAEASVNFRAYVRWTSLSRPGSVVPRGAVALAIAAKPVAGTSPFYELDLMDYGRDFLTQYIDEQCAEILNLVQEAKRAATAKNYSDQMKKDSAASLQKAEARLMRAHTAFIRLIATRKDMCLDEAILAAAATPGANKLLAKAIREQQSGLLGQGETVVDSIEYHQQAASAQLRSLVAYAKGELDAPKAEAIPSWETFFLAGAKDFVEKGAPEPYDKKAEKAAPSVILQEFLEGTE